MPIPLRAWLRRETAGGRHGDTSKIVAGVRAAEGVVEAQLGTGRAIGCCRGVCGGLEITGCTRYRGYWADIVVYNCWPPLPYHHPHFSGPPPSSSHPLHYPGDPYYVNSVASEMSVDRPTSQVYAGCCSAPRTRGVGGTGATPIIVSIYLDGVAGGSGRPFSAGLGRDYFWRLALLFLATCSSRSAITSGIKYVFQAGKAAALRTRSRSRRPGRLSS